jgi:hypothetical protein
MAESLSLFTVFSALDETYFTDIGVPTDRQFRAMPSYNRYQQRPTPQEIDAYLQALEHELAQRRGPMNAPRASAPIEKRCSDLHGPLWLLLMIGVGFFVWLLWMIEY